MFYPLKMFEENLNKNSNKANMALVVRICADTIGTGKGGLHATKIACLLITQVVRTNPSKSLLSQVIKCGFSMMRQENPDSERVQSVLQLFCTMTSVLELKVLITTLVERDEEKYNQNLLLLNLKKDPLKHGALSETAADLLASLDIDLNIDLWVDEQFNEVYEILNGPKTSRNICFIYSKLASLANLLKSSISPAICSTQKISSSKMHMKVYCHIV